MKTIISLSGGIDSTVLLAFLRTDENVVHGVSYDYGQRHRRELESATSISRFYGADTTTLNLTSLSTVFAGSSLTTPSMDVPHGHYQAESMKTTVVPNRNMIFLAVATALAISLEFDSVAYAAHAGDHHIYPDCRPAFADALQQAIFHADDSHVRLLRPFIRKTKTDIVRLGAALEVPFELTWSCYQGGSVHCGECGTCFERREAFFLAGVTDPTEYAQCS